MTYKDWPLLSSKQFAECGFYFTGLSDCVTCFSCGGSLGHWERNDNPWDDHTKFFPNFAYLSLVRRHDGMQLQLSEPMPQAPQPVVHQQQSGSNLSTSLENEIISKASNIVGKDLVQKVMAEHLKESSQHFTSFIELCNAILAYKEKHTLSVCCDETGIWEEGIMEERNLYRKEKRRKKCETNTDDYSKD